MNEKSETSKNDDETNELITFSPLSDKVLQDILARYYDGTNNAYQTYAHFLTCAGLLAAILEIDEQDIIDHSKIALKAGKQAVQLRPDIFQQITPEPRTSSPDTLP